MSAIQNRYIIVFVGQASCCSSICCFSMSYFDYLNIFGLGLLVGQNKTFEDITLGNCDQHFSQFLLHVLQTNQITINQKYDWQMGSKDNS